MCFKKVVIRVLKQNDLIYRSLKSLQMRLLPYGKAQILTYKPIANISLKLKIDPNEYKEFYSETYEKEVLEFILSLKLKTGTVIDVGAHFGYYSLVLAQLMEEGVIIAVEPSSANIIRIKENISLNKVASKVDVKIVEMAITNHGKGELLYFAPEFERAASSGNFLESVTNELSDSFKESASIKKRRVTTTTLDQLVYENDLQDLKLIKIDIEGAEWMALEKSVFVLTHVRPVWIVEIHSREGYDKISRHFTTYGYQVTILFKEGEERCIISAIPQTKVLST